MYNGECAHEQHVRRPKEPIGRRRRLRRLIGSLRRPLTLTLTLTYTITQMVETSYVCAYISVQVQLGKRRVEKDFTPCHVNETA